MLALTSLLLLLSCWVRANEFLVNPNFDDQLTNTGGWFCNGGQCLARSSNEGIDGGPCGKVTQR